VKRYTVLSFLFMTVAVAAVVWSAQPPPARELEDTARKCTRQGKRTMMLNLLLSHDTSLEGAGQIPEMLARSG
jgi:hypothetical protein